MFFVIPKLFSKCSLFSTSLPSSLTGIGGGSEKAESIFIFYGTKPEISIICLTLSVLKCDFFFTSFVFLAFQAQDDARTDRQHLGKNDVILSVL